MASPGALLLKLIIDGTNAGAIRALAQTSAESQKTAAALGGIDKASGGFGNTRASLAAVEGQLKSLQALGRNALQFAGIGVGITELIQLGDTYTQMTSRLKLVTQYTGDYAEVQQLLRNSASTSRSDLVATVDLYSQMSPALKGIGLSAAQSVGVITTINQAIALSGASSQAAQAALVQLGQGFASGALRGEELNSIMEQTPALAQAIADGLGVSRGALRKMGEEGKLTAEAVATALQKVADQVNGDFSKAPVTVGQAFTLLKNEILVAVGLTDQASGGTSTLAEAIKGLADEVRVATPFFTTMGQGLSYIAQAADATYRVIKVMAQSLVAYLSIAAMALVGNFAKAKEIYAYLGQEIEKSLTEPLLGASKKQISATTDTAQKRQQLEKQLADEVTRLERLKEYEASGSLTKIAGKEKAAIDARIADQQRLVDAVRTAWQQQLAEAEKFAEAAKAKLSKATDFRDAGKSAAFSASLKGMSEEDQIAAKSSRMTDLQGQGSYEAARARMAALEGDVKKFDAASAQAEKRLKEALQLAQDIGDVASIESISETLAKNQESGAALDQKKAADAQARAADQAKLLGELQKQLQDLTDEARTIEVKADVAAAETAISGLNKQLAELKDKTVTVTVNTVNTGNAPAATPTDAVPARAFGGPLPGWAPHDRADNMLYRGTPGEWVIQRPSVRYWGPEFMRAINERRMPKFAFGGQLGGSNSLAGRVSVPRLGQGNAAAQSSATPLVLDFGALGRYKASAERDTADQIVRVFRNAALGRGRF